MDIDFSFKFEKVAASPNYKFLSHNPVLSYRNKNFISHDRKPIKRYENYYDLYLLGKEAFDLIQIRTEREFLKLSKSYFLFINMLLAMTIELNSNGKLPISISTNTGRKVSTLPYLIEIFTNPDFHKLTGIAPDLIKIFNHYGNRLNLQNNGNEGDEILNDVYLASLFHTLIEVDNALIAYDIDSSSVIHYTKVATSCLEIAKEITNKKNLSQEQRTVKAKFAANMRHKYTNDAKEKIKLIWASGKYSSRDICAEQECAALNLSFSTARKALRNTPDNK